MLLEDFFVLLPCVFRALFCCAVFASCPLLRPTPSDSLRSASRSLTPLCSAPCLHLFAPRLVLRFAQLHAHCAIRPTALSLCPSHNSTHYPLRSLNFTLTTLFTHLHPHYAPRSVIVHLLYTYSICSPTRALSRATSSRRHPSSSASRFISSNARSSSSVNPVKSGGISAIATLGAY